MKVQGKVVSVGMYNRTTRWGKIQIEDPNKKKINVVGVIPSNVIEGRWFTIDGKFEKHPKYGDQIKMEEIKEIDGTAQTEDDLLNFLKHFSGIGPAIARKIWAEWGDDSERVLREETHRLAAISGISAGKVDEIERQLEEMGRDGDIISAMMKFRIQMRFLEPIKKKFNRRAVDIVTKHAYELMQVHGIGFVTADRVGQRQGIPWDAPERIKAGILFTLGNSLDGSMYTDAMDLMANSRRLLKGIGDGRTIPVTVLSDTLNKLIEDGDVVCEKEGDVVPCKTMEDDCYTHSNHRIERGAARSVFTMSQSPIEKIQSSYNIWNQLSEDQAAAVDMVMQERISIITGPAGSGKTTVLKEVIAKGASQDPLVVCFTGRAAQRVAEVSGHNNCSTIHRALKYRPGTGFQHDQKDPLPEDLVLVDEASMIGLDLTLSLLKATSADRQRIVFTGDPSQLPSISSGNFLHELVQSGLVPCTELQYVYRNQNTILDNANKIREGSPSLVYDGTFRFHMDEDPRDVFQDHYKDPENTMVLSGIKDGNVGVRELNKWLQWQQGVKGAVKIGGDYMANIGDKVIHIKNNYEKEVFNGNIGWITYVYAAPGEHPEVHVEYREGLVPKTVIYTGVNELEELELAYCLTVHKAQGAEAEHVFLILENGHYPVQSRNWMYTGVTRAQKRVDLIGQENVAMRCIKSQDVSKGRLSKLGLRLQKLHEQAKS